MVIVMESLFLSGGNPGNQLSSIQVKILFPSLVSFDTEKKILVDVQKL
jgi:hypothetical protein